MKLPPHSAVKDEDEREIIWWYFEECKTPLYLSMGIQNIL